MRKKAAGLVAGGTAITVGLATGALALTLSSPPVGDEAVLFDMAGNAVTPDAGLTADPAPVHHVGDGRLVIPSVDLNVPLGEMRTVNGVVAPPGFDSAYVVRDVGSANGLTLVAMHSMRGGGVGPGNALIDVKEGRVRVERGETIRLDGVDYTVTETAVVPKRELSHRTDIWNDEPGRLVLTTCLQNAQNTPSATNAVIIAHRM